MESIKPEKFITLTQAAKLLGIGRNTFYKWLRQGMLPNQIKSECGRPMGYTEELLIEWQQKAKQRAMEMSS